MIKSIKKAWQPRGMKEDGINRNRKFFCMSGK